MTTGKGLAVAALLGLGAWTIPAPAQAADDPIRLHEGIVADLSDGWRLRNPGGTVSASGRLRRVHLVCETPECKRTEETCTFLLRRDPVEGADDAARLAGLYASPLSRYARIRAVLKNTSVGAEIRQNLHRTQIGSRDWWVVETDAKDNKKSGLFAETVIDGQYVGAICKTCETGEIRHQTARRMLESIRREGEIPGPVAEQDTGTGRVAWRLGRIQPVGQDAGGTAAP